MTRDVVRELGFLALGTRLKRIGERLQAQTQAVLDDVRIDVPASHCPALVALGRLGRCGVVELAEAVGVSQPGMSRQLDNLEAAGLVRRVASGTDQRSRPIELTRTGHALLARAARDAWPAVESAVADACGADGTGLLRRLAALEDALAAEPLQRRARRPHPGERRRAPA